MSGPRATATVDPAMLKSLRRRFPNRYEIRGLVGQGGMANVFLATDRRLDRPVAIKVLHPDLAGECAVERFLREIRFMAALQHPNIIPLLDGGNADGLLYAVMPYVEGATLRERLADGPLPIGEAVHVTATIAGALAYAHRIPLVHRDIKPENILISHGEPLLADFGLARAVDLAGGSTLPGSGTVVGTLIYMSPEQADASQPVDGRSDIYSLGCVLYELLAGAPPFTGSDMAAILPQKFSGGVPPVRRHRPDVPSALAATVHRMLAADPAERIQRAEEVVEALAGSFEAGGRRASGPSARPAGDGRWLMLAAGIALLALILTLLRDGLG